MDAGALRAAVQRLREQAAEQRMRAEQAVAAGAQAEAALAALTRKNEELVLAKAKVSEKDLEELQR
jgi:hypothetical protein